MLLTNSFEFSVEDISEIYRLRWTIESLYKQLKQNFPLHFFYGDSIDAIQIQTWVVLIANLLITVLSRSIKRSCAFSQVVTMVRLTLMYYIDFVALWKILTKHGTIFWPRRGKKHHQNLLLSIRGAYFWEKEVRSLISQGFGQGCYARLSFTGQQYLNVIPHELTGYGCLRSFWLRLRVLGIKNVFAKQYFCIFGVYYYVENN